MNKVKLIKKVVVYAVFITGATTIVVLASGIAINLKTKQIGQYGGIDISFDPEAADLKINNVLKSKQASYTSTQIIPGSYDIIISEEGYMPWHSTVVVKPGSVTKKEIILYKVVFTKTNVLPEDKENVLTIIKNASADGYGQISYKDNEIYINNAFVTRFSENVKNTVWYGENRLLVQVGQEIRLIEINEDPKGENAWSIDNAGSIVLRKLDANEKAFFASSKNGKIVYIQNGVELYSLTVR